ncbi:TetR/AcrR family transcriptional regulator [Nocardia rhizosphaerae]|uniref:TetR/AcrR family transcriptional regulator n=1 Tax=Nocardia rhizosphaerae TaxID=1691571 RepID=A0ABV8LAI9_9NOCA
MSIESGSTGVRPKRRNGPRLPPEERRTQLLDAALRVVDSEGLGNLTMQAVAKEAGVAKPVLYAMYPSAPELVAHLLHREHSRGMGQVFAALPRDLAGSDPDREYVAAVMAFLESVAAAPSSWRLILLPSEGAPADYRELLGAARDKLLDQCVELLTAGFALRGGPRDVDVELIATVMVGFTEVLGRMVLSDPQRFPPERLRATVRSMVRTLPYEPGGGNSGDSAGRAGFATVGEHAADAR